MTPQRRTDFEREWPELARRLSYFLARSGVSNDMRDDVIQDTALRLYGMWMRVENDRSAWPLTKTIALNLVRDAARRKGSYETASEVPELPSSHDVESSGIARLELRRVERALSEMSPAHRSLILEEVGGGAPAVATSPAAEKMMRMRARRKLMALLEKVSSLVPGLRTGLDWMSSTLAGARDMLAGGFACLLCVALGTGIAVVVSPSATRPAQAAHPSRSSVTLDADALRQTAASKGVGSAVRDAYRFTSAVRDKGGRSAGAAASEGAAPAAEGGSEPLPIPEEVPGTGVHTPPTDGLGGVADPPDGPPTKTGLEAQIQEVVERVNELVPGGTAL